MTVAFEKLSAKHLVTFEDLLKQASPSVRRHFACDCAERALLAERAMKREPLRASWLAVRVARRFAEGRATEGELDNVCYAAEKAAYSVDWVVNRKSYAVERAYWAAQAAIWVAKPLAHNAAICAAESLIERAKWTVEEGEGRGQERIEAAEKEKAWQIARLRFLVEQHEQARIVLDRKSTRLNS